MYLKIEKKNITITTFLLLIGSMATFLIVFDEIDLIGWGDPIVLKEKIISKDGQSGIWTGDYDYHLDCGDCIIKNQYSLIIDSYDSSATLIEAWSDYENIIYVPVFDLIFGRTKDSNHFISSVYEFRGGCLVRMANNKDEAKEVGPPKFKYYTENGCKLKADDYPVHSYEMERQNEALILTRFQ